MVSMFWTHIQFPKDLLSWIEAHHGLASWFEALGVIGSLWLTQRIASREQRAAHQNRLSYRKLLIEAFQNLREPLAYLDQLNIEAPAHNPALAVQGSAQETANQMAAAILRMQDAEIIVRALEDINRLDEFNAILATFAARRVIEDAKPVFQKELAWLQEHGSSTQVVNNAMSTIAPRATELVAIIDKVLSALKHRTD